MKHLVLIVPAVALAVAFGAAQTGQQSPTLERQHRTMHRSGHPLEELLTPGADRLVVEKDQSPPMIVGPPPGSAELEWRAKRAPTVVILEVETVTSQLTPARDWIESEVHANVEQVLKYSPVVIPGSSVKFHQDGGEMMIQGTRVTAVLEYADGFVPKGRYLVFPGTTDSDETLSVEPLFSYLIDGAERLVPLAHEGKPTSEHGVPLSVAIARIKAALNKRP
jgi:hypothetical protein